jgi:ligand-binding sensor domain-containing protein
MAFTAITRITKRPFTISGDGTNYYVGSGGKVWQIVVSGLAKTILANIAPEEITAMIGDGTTYLYVGTNKGRIVRITTANGTKTSMGVLLRGEIIAMSLKTTTLYIGLSNGKIYTHSTTPD